MRPFSLVTLATAAAAAAFTTFATDASASSAQLDAAGVARLEALRESPESAGALIYRGAVFAQGRTDAAPLFTYERRVARAPDGMSSAHVTRDPSGDVIIAEQARFTACYALQRFDATNRQLGYSGSVVLSNGGRHLEYRLNQNGEVSTASEDVSDPVVSGPSLHGFILHHWDALAQGGSMAVRMIVMTNKETFGFQIRRLAQAEGRTSFSITPTHLLVRLAVAPLVVTFDSTTRNVIRYEGRVPPMQADGGDLRNLDARVDYTMNVTTYR